MIERKVCECEDLELRHCWDCGQFIIIREYTHGIIQCDGTRIIHAKCGRPVDPKIIYSWRDTRGLEFMKFTGRHILKA